MRMAHTAVACPLVFNEQGRLQVLSLLAEQVLSVQSAQSPKTEKPAVSGGKLTPLGKPGRGVGWAAAQVFHDRGARIAVNVAISMGHYQRPLV